MNSAKFSLEIERIVIEEKVNYIEAIILFCEENSIEVDSVSKLISKPLKEKIKRDAIDLNFMKKTTRAKLPLWKDSKIRNLIVIWDWSGGPRYWYYGLIFLQDTKLYWYCWCWGKARRIFLYTRTILERPENQYKCQNLVLRWKWKAWSYWCTEQILDFNKIDFASWEYLSVYSCTMGI